MAENRQSGDRDGAPVALSSDEQEGFLRRWSRRKTTGETEELPVTREQADQDLVVPEQSALPAETSPVKTDADMPPVESLNADSDYSEFMSPGVSDGLRRLALRKLFHSATFNITDGLDDYDEDFTTFEPLGDIITSDMRHQMEVEAKKLQQKLAESDGSPTGEQLETNETLVETSELAEDANEENRGEDSVTEEVPQAGNDTHDEEQKA